jgi:SAM-dependent methyltransferase
MKRPNKLRTKIKNCAYRLLTPVIADKLRNIYNHKYKYIYDKKLEKRVYELLCSRDLETPVSEDISLLEELHKIFPKYDNVENYKLDMLLGRARETFKYLLSVGVEVEGKDLVDFGAGHGENLMMVDEFKLKSSTGYDFSDKDYNKYKGNLSPKILDNIKFICKDLVSEDIGHKNCDIILSFSAFEHFADPQVVLNRCYNALRPGGYLYVEFAAFNAPFATHRKKFSGVPYVQNIFNDKTAFDFFYKKLKINEGVNRYTGEKITDGNPYPEVNRWKITDYENAFLNNSKWGNINYTKIINYQYSWFVNLFKDEFSNLSRDDIYADYLKFVLIKK